MNEIGFARLSLSGDWGRLRFVNAQNIEVYATSFQRKPKIWAELLEQKGNRLVARLRMPNNEPIDSLKAEFLLCEQGYDPFSNTNSVVSLPAEYEGSETETGLHVFETTLPADSIGKFSLVRFFVPSENRWIYADSGAGLKSGNYDGLTDWVRIVPFSDAV
jgi:hypothetical protein